MLADAAPALAVMTAAALAGLPVPGGVPRVVLDDPDVAAAVAACPGRRRGMRTVSRRCGGGIWRT